MAHCTHSRRLRTSSWRTERGKSGSNTSAVHKLIDSLISSHQLQVTILLLCLFVRSSSTHYSIVGPFHRLILVDELSEQLGEK